MFRKCNNFKYLLILAIILVCLPVTSALAATKLNLYYYGTKQNVTYTDKQVKYTYNGSAINMRNTPGILINGTSLASFNDVFVKSAIKLNYKYNDAKGVLALSKNGITLVLTAGSKKATLNGKTVNLSVAPMKVQFKDRKVTKLLVPARYVAETFGFKYDWNSTTSTAAITSGLHLNYNNKDVTYTGTQGKVTVDGDSINLGTMPSIIIDNTALIRAWKVFSTSSIGADYYYNSSTKVLTMKLEDTVVILTMGSKTATVNGKARTMDTAPLLVKNKDTNESAVMVPGSFAASFLGYDYTWDNSARTSVITTRPPEDEETQDEEDGPELGGDPLPDAISLNWELGTNLADEYNKVSSLTDTIEVSEDTSFSSDIDSIDKESATEDNYEVYSIHASAPFSKSTLTLQDQILNLHINNSSINNGNYNFNSNLINTIDTSANFTDLTADINFNLLSPDTSYELSLSDDKCTLYVTLYPNYLTNIEAGIISGNEYVKITGLKAPDVNLTEDGNFIYLQMTNTVNGVGENYLNTALNSLQSVQSTSESPNMTSIIIERADSAAYTVTAADNTYLITFNNDSPTVISDSDYALQFNLPDEVFYSEVTTEDLYYKNQIIIRIPGDYTDFYNNNPISTSDSVVSDVSVSYEDSMTEITICTNKLQGYKLKDLDGSVGIVLGNPTDIYKNIVVLDAGHGGTDPGAMRKLNGVTINEKDINFKIMYQLTQKYFNAEGSEIKAYYSRYDDTKVDLYERAAFADKVGADLFVSLHMNANNSSSPKGTEIYYTGSNKATTENGLNSKILANMFLNTIPYMIGTDKRYISDKSLAVCRANTVPAILVELGFMSNSSDLALMVDPDFQEQSAEAIYDTLCDVFSAYPTGR
ncbi:MAG: N-acetylmuramoyl-L-alanine amidase [Anaerocolumna sp.]